MAEKGELGEEKTESQTESEDSKNTAESPGESGDSKNTAKASVELGGSKTIAESPGESSSKTTAESGNSKTGTPESPGKLGSKTTAKSPVESGDFKTTAESPAESGGCKTTAKSPVESGGSKTTAESPAESGDSKATAEAPAESGDSKAAARKYSSSLEDNDESDGEGSETDDSIFDDPIILIDDLINVGATGVNLNRRCNALGEVLVWVPQSFADRCGVRKKDCVCSLDGQIFSTLEELCKHAEEIEREKTLTIKFLKEIIDPKAGSSRMETFVINQIYTSLTKQHHPTKPSGRPFQGWKTEKYYLRCNQNGFYVTVEEGKLTLKQTMDGVVFKVHTGIEVKRNPDSPRVVVLEHKKSKMCVSLTSSGISLVPNIVEASLVLRDKRMFNLLDVQSEDDGKDTKFESYHRKKAGVVEFLGFENDGGNWKPVVIPEQAKDGEEDGEENGEKDGGNDGGNDGGKDGEKDGGNSGEKGTGGQGGEKDGAKDGEKHGEKDGWKDGWKDGEKDDGNSGEKGTGGQGGEKDGAKDGDKGGEKDGGKDGEKDGEKVGGKDGEKVGEKDGEKDDKKDGEKGGEKDGVKVCEKDGGKDGANDCEEDCGGVGGEGGENDGKESGETEAPLPNPFVFRLIKKAH